MKHKVYDFEARDLIRNVQVALPLYKGKKIRDDFLLVMKRDSFFQWNIQRFTATLLVRCSFEFSNVSRLTGERIRITDQIWRSFNNFVVRLGIQKWIKKMLFSVMNCWSRVISQFRKK